MADEGDVASEVSEIFLRSAILQRKKEPPRNEHFCDCVSWMQDLTFCGNKQCPVDYEGELRRAAAQKPT